jgi:hypothetical protein
LALCDIADEFPFVEWGILRSYRQYGPRWPSEAWMVQLAHFAAQRPLNLSLHLCGQMVRSFLCGRFDWTLLGDLLPRCQRIQINTHQELHSSSIGYMDLIDQVTAKEFIFQWDGVNNHYAIAAHECGLDVSSLFDFSGGKGILPGVWPKPMLGKMKWYGYAGGLSPENLIRELPLIHQVAIGNYWIDVETHVRTEDGRSLDLVKVRRFLELCQIFMTNH